MFLDSIIVESARMSDMYLVTISLQIEENIKIPLL